MMKIAQEICSTNEGVAFARKFLYVDSDQLKGLNKANQKFEFYEPLRIFFENVG